MSILSSERRTTLNRSFKWEHGHTRASSFYGKRKVTRVIWKGMPIGYHEITNTWWGGAGWYYYTDLPTDRSDAGFRTADSAHEADDLLLIWCLEKLGCPITKQDTMSDEDKLFFLIRKWTGK